MDDGRPPGEIEAWDAQMEQVFDRLEGEWQARSEGARAAANQISDLASSLDGQLAEVNYAEAVETMQALGFALEGTGRGLAELALLSRIRDGNSVDVTRPANLPETPRLEPSDLFVEGVGSSADEDDDSDLLVHERVGWVAIHTVKCVMATSDALDEAISAAEAGAGDAAQKARDHAVELARLSQEGFDLWCETLEGVLGQTGHYPGLGGEYVDEFMHWLRQQRGRP